jgi:hypothetical protein
MGHSACFCQAAPPNAYIVTVSIVSGTRLSLTHFENNLTNPWMLTRFHANKPVATRSETGISAQFI